MLIDITFDISSSVIAILFHVTVVALHGPTAFGSLAFSSPANR